GHRAARHRRRDDTRGALPTGARRQRGGRLPRHARRLSGDEGGGRILGEACHFVDLARVIIGAPILSVQAEAGAVIDGAADDVTTQLRFADGSLATIAYTALGDTAFPKERIEMFSGGRVAVLEDYRSLSVTEDGKTRTLASGTQDKGLDAALAAFVAAVTGQAPVPMDENELIESSVATLAILESLSVGRKIEL
ncbi:MAG: Gfo/Idh/MocA family protein, partial [Rhodospirillales bacterium]